MVITLDNNQTKNTEKIPVEFESSFLFQSKDFFQTGLIRIDYDRIDKRFLPFIFQSIEENCYYLSSNLIQKWFNTLLLVNRTCDIAKQFLMGDKNQITYLFQDEK